MWDRAIVLGHSWGGHLLLHIVAAHADRLTAAVSLDGIGAVEDGGLAAFTVEMVRRLPQDARVRVEALESVEADRPLTPEEQDEELELVWPSYFASPAVAPPFTAIKSSVEATQGGFAALLEALPTLASRLSETPVRTLLVACTRGPIPARAAEDTASAMGSRAAVLALPDLGHFPWLEQPGVVRRLVDEFMSADVGSSPRRIPR
jgi:pimeloyl-ACP methyl ester carboxylesterase